MKIFRESLALDDVLLVPKHSDIKSRAEIDLSVKLSKGISVKHPLVPSNMKSIQSYEMALKIIESGGMAVMHRFMPMDSEVGESQLGIVRQLKEVSGAQTHLAVSIGVKPEDKYNVDRFVEEGIKIICIDVAHGHSDMCIGMTKYVADRYPDVLLISGNVATGDGAQALWGAGADVVKFGVGQGSICSTRIQTGNGVPTMSCLIDGFERREMLKNSGIERFEDRELFIMQDGGIRNSGDCVKALCFADLLMCGNAFAGCAETPGREVDVDGVRYKHYDGSSTHKVNHIEGVKSLVKVKSKYSETLQTLHEGIKSGLSYQGAHNLKELKLNPEFIRITGAGIVESNPHDVKVIG